MSSLIDILNNHINSRFTYSKEKKSYINENDFDDEGGILAGIGRGIKSTIGHVIGNTNMQVDAETAAAREHHAALRRLASQAQSHLDKIHNVLPQPQPQLQAPTAPQPSFNQDENHAASAIEHLGRATGQFVQQNPLAAGAIGTAGAIGAGIMAKRAMQNRQ